MPEQELWRGDRAPGPGGERHRSLPRHPPTWLVPAAALTAAVLMLAALAVVVLGGRSEVSLDELVTGDCLVSDDIRVAADEITELARADCSEAHDAEVYAILEDAGADHADACVTELGAIGTSLPVLADNGWQVRPLSPADRSPGPVVCVARPADGEQRSGSAFA